MTHKKLNILGINGSASKNSSNHSILKNIAQYCLIDFELTILEDLSVFPHFKTKLTDKNTPEKIIRLRTQIEKADGILFSSPEYVFSIPSGLKNIIKWFVSTTVFSDKPIGIITASASGEKGHEELKLIMKTLQANFTDETTLLIQGVKGKVNKEGEITDNKTEEELKEFVNSFHSLIKHTPNLTNYSFLVSPNFSTL